MKLSASPPSKAVRDDSFASSFHTHRRHVAVAWVRVSFIAMLLMAIAGIAPIRSRLPILSLRVRIALGIGIVFLMISKLAAAGSILVIGLALLAGIAASFFRPHPAAAADAPLSSGGPVW